MSANLIPIPYMRQSYWGDQWHRVCVERFPTTRHGRKVWRWRLRCGNWSSHNSYGSQETATLVAAAKAMNDVGWRKVDPTKE